MKTPWTNLEFMSPCNGSNWRSQRTISFPSEVMAQIEDRELDYHPLDFCIISFHVMNMNYNLC